MTLEILAVQGIPEVAVGDSLAHLIVTHAPALRDGDVLVVTSKVVSKAEGQIVDVDREQAIEDETVRVVASRGDTRIVARTSRRERSSCCPSTPTHRLVGFAKASVPSPASTSESSSATRSGDHGGSASPMPPSDSPVSKPSKICAAPSTPTATNCE
jgi:hypothetical protein